MEEEMQCLPKNIPLDDGQRFFCAHVCFWTFIKACAKISALPTGQNGQFENARQENLRWHFRMIGET